MNLSVFLTKARKRGSDKMNGIQMLFNWVMFSSAIASLIVIMILLAKSIFRTKMSAGWHYYIWVLLIIRLIIPYAPESPFSIYNFTKSPMGHLAPSIDTDTGRTENAWSDSADNESNQAVAIQYQQSQQNQKVNKDLVKFVAASLANFYKNSDIKSKLILIWLIGVLVFAFHISVINCRFLLETRACPQLYDNTINQVLDECRSKMRVYNNIPIVLSKVVSSPSLFGIIRPRILLPYEMFEKISETDLKYIFLHELAHLKRKDLIVNWITVILKTLHWFNPLIWYGFYKMYQDCEVSCDALVLSKMNPEEHVEYGYTIIRLLKIVSKPQWIPGITALSADKSQIKRRITMISLFKKNTWKWTAVGAAIILIISFFMLTNAKSDPLKTTGISTVSTNLKEDSDNISKSEKVSSDITVLDVEGRGFKGKMLIIPDPKKIAVGYDLEISKTTSEIAKDNKAVSAVNAGGFGSNKSDESDLKPSGIIVHQGKVIYNELKDENIKQEIVGFTEDGKLIVGSHSLIQLKKYGVREAVSFGPPLIVNGNPTIKEGDGGWGIAPRTAIGQKEDGTVLFLVIDGRSINYSLGGTLLDVQNILLKQGAVNASNLDGGSSSTMFLNGKVINKPSDSKGERLVPSIFMVLP